MAAVPVDSFAAAAASAVDKVVANSVNFPTSGVLYVSSSGKLLEIRCKALDSATAATTSRLIRRIASN